MKHVTIANSPSIFVSCPEYPLFGDRALAMGGVPEPTGWTFRKEDEPRVRELCREMFGTDGSDMPDLCVVRVDGSKLGADVAWSLLGRVLAKRTSHRHRVVLGDGVRLVDGGFHQTGGSASYPKLAPLPTCILEVRDVPLGLAERTAAAMPDVIEIVEVTRSRVEDESTTPAAA